MLKLYFLGKTRYETADGQSLIPKLRRKTRALLAYVCLSNQPVHREQLMALFCSASDDPARSLRWHLSRIRRDFAETVLLLHDGYVQVDLQHVWIDALAFVSDLTQANQPDPHAHLIATLALYQGELLADMSLPDAADFELWLLGQRAHYQRLFEQASLTVVQELIQQVAYDQALGLLQQVLAQNSLLEDAHYWVMWLYARTGQRPQAVQQYVVYEQLLWKDLATPPSKRMASLRQQLEVQQLPDTLVSASASLIVASPELDMVFCGREGELERLWELWNCTRIEYGAAVLVEGDAGIGKSALVRTFIRELYPIATVLQGTCYESTMPVVLAPWLPIIRQAVQLLLEQQVALSSIMLHRLRLVLPDLLPVPSKDQVILTDHELDARLLLTTMVEVLTLVVRQSPTLLVLEDVHFADDFSVQLLTLVLQRLAELPVLLVLTQRPLDVQQNPPLQTAITEWGRMQGWEKLELVPLEVAAVVEVLAQLVPDVVDKPTVAESLLQHTMGVSLYLMEVVYACQANPRLVNELPMPPSFAKLVEQRLMRMTDPQRQTLEALAVFAFPATLPMLLACTTQSEVQLLHSLEYALGQRFITEQVVEQQTYYIFAHVLFQKVIFGFMSEIRKQRLHQRSAEQLEKLTLVLPIEKRQEFVSRLVYHAQRAGDVERLMRWVPIAAHAAKEAFAYRQVLVLYEDLDTVLQQTPSVSIDAYTGILLEMVKVLRLLGEWNVQEAVLQRIATWYHQHLLTNTDLLKELFNEYGVNQMRLGNYRAAQEYLLQARSFAENSGDTTMLGRIYYNLGAVVFYQSDWDISEDYYAKSLAIWERLSDNMAIDKIYNNLGSIAYQKGKYDLAVEYFTRNLTIREKHNNRHATATTLSNLGLLCVALGRLEDAESYSLRALDMRKELEDQHGIASTLSNLGELCVTQKRLVDALEYYQQSLNTRQSIGDKVGIAHSLNGLGETYLHMEQFDTAIAYLTQSLEMRQSLGAKMETAETMLNISFVHAVIDDSLPDDSFYEALEIGYSINSIYIMLRALTQFAYLLMNKRDYALAAQYVGLVDRHSQDARRLMLDEVISSLPSFLGTREFQHRMEQGAALDIREVVEGLLRDHRPQAFNES